MPIQNGSSYLDRLICGNSGTYHKTYKNPAKHRSSGARHGIRNDYD